MWRDCWVKGRAVPTNEPLTVQNKHPYLSTWIKPNNPWLLTTILNFTTLLKRVGDQLYVASSLGITSLSKLMKDLLCNSWSSGNKTHPNKSALDKGSPGSDIASLLRHWASFGVSLHPSGLWSHNRFRYLEGLGYSHDDPIFFLLSFPQWQL